ncbi:MAG: thermonuclease family protein [Hydrogenovibrio sp.]|nr:thermonuclease family protein [Hydrogenovibrio sp.]
MNKLHSSRPMTLLLSLCLILLPALVLADDCAPKNISLWAKASFALSGDSVIIQNHRYRLIGVRAPQIEKKQKFYTRGQPLAKQSQDYLNRLLANHDMQIGIEYDQRKQDDFNRGLAHLFVKGKDGQILNLQRLMLASGYALAESEKPNFLHQKCYYRAEKQAREQNLALWSLVKKYPQLHFPIAPSSEITTQDEGYHIYKGKILLVKKSSNNYILNMDTTGIRVRRADWDNFDFDQLKSLEGKTIEARGTGFLYKGAMFVKIQSPYAINLLNPVNDANQ